MPAFVTNGPDIPERLLQAHEEGRVVFFCGAGISYPAGLPGFKGLVDRIYDQLGTECTSIEKQTYDKKQYDATLDQLERRYPGQRIAVRMALANVLKPKWRKNGAVKTHQALLQLATDRIGKVRLVTTNFDRIFQRVITRQKPDIPIYAAPLLPIPKPTRWHGVVHLHGLLTASPDETVLNRLILTSGDFGLAYLTERWAARFVSDLFRYYTVCFVGYGINDPVLRYMVDALAVDEMLGETRPEAYAFASFSDGEQEQTLIEWKAKGVTPLLYEVLGDTSDHSVLHHTLKEWADTYRDGVRGKEMIIAQHATTPPLAPFRTDFAVGRVLWALTDGLAAKHFADLNPVPPLEWLGPLTERQYGHEDLSRFGVVPGNKRDPNLFFSVIRRPTPATHAPWMCIVDTNARKSNWDDVMRYIASWLIRHLDDPRLVIWLANHGGQLHEQFSQLIANRIEQLYRLKVEENKETIRQILEAAPNAIPGSLMRTLWRLFLSGRIKSNAIDPNLFYWIKGIEQDGITPILRMQLRQVLKPCVKLRERFTLKDEIVSARKPERMTDLVDWELALSIDQAYSWLQELGKSIIWQETLPNLLQDFSILLEDALDLLSELGGADGMSDLSYVHQPSISKHPQNRDYYDWTVLIDLTRDAWLAKLQLDPNHAKLIAEGVLPPTSVAAIFTLEI